jgi:hypothetical protein
LSLLGGHSDLRISQLAVKSTLYSGCTAITGNAGSGKTFTALTLNLYDACVCVPNNNLLLKFRAEYPGVPCMTYHKAFQIQWNKKTESINGKPKERVLDDRVPPPRKYSNYILDECSMICKGVMNNILTHKNAKDANFVLIHDRAQLAAIIPENSKWEHPEARYFTNGEEYKKRNWYEIHLTEQKRQNDAEFIAKLDKCRSLQDEKEGLEQMVQLFKDRIVTEEEAIQRYNYKTYDLLIASTVDEVKRWNEIFRKNAAPGELKVKYETTAKSKKYVKNLRLIMQSEVKIKPLQSLAFAATVHLVQ